MHGAHEVLQAIAIVLCVAAVTTVLFQKLRQPVVLGYILAGLVVGPFVPIPLVANPEVVTTLSELGVILLMFSLGLEFSLRKLFSVGFTAGVTAVIQCSIMVWLGFVVGRAFGWTTLESLFTGALIAISSTTIIAKAFDEQGIRGKLRELVVGVLIVEDLIAVLLMATLTAVSTGAGLNVKDLTLTTGKLVAFLVGLVAVGLFIIPRAMRAVIKLNRPETTLVTSVGICFAVALLAQSFGYSVALGAFLAGSLVAESGEEKLVEHLVQPVRDMFAAIFFVSVGMLINPELIVEHWAAILVLTAVVILGKLLSVTLGAFLTGNGTRTSVQAGMSLAQIGEFSFIIAGLGLSLKATGSFIYPVAVAVSAITTLTTPLLIKVSGPVATWVDRKLPKPLQTFVTLYGTWVERLRQAPRRETLGADVRRLIRLLVLDAVLLVTLVIGTTMSAERMAGFVETRTGLDEDVSKNVILGGAVLLSVPFILGVIGIARRLGATLAEAALPARKDGKLDLAAAPRRVLLVTLQVGIVLLVGIPVVMVTQPFLKGATGPLIVLTLVGALGVAFWRGATNLHGHVRAGAQVIVAALAAQSHSKEPGGDEHALDHVQGLLPGLGAPASVRLEEKSPVAGKTLAQVNLRGLTGATVLAIQRGEESLSVPTAQEVLRAGDVLALTGTCEAVDAAKALLMGVEPAAPPPEPPAPETRAHG
ncbi:MULTISPECIES: cation:proton antiporter [Myxococcus]|uniref:Potassium transporter n=1 Tax=Myxococcus llanfairpwllgwyngyllgogerychwyrndrobwllllantysiliogogogochensis TaxID=2590453 RepID=A0A540X716_9BACT|nr:MULTISPECIES: cation:proton antiporter [Myxococcus]NTX02926.1 cation:proton antiporter [Myxococcus sp. CA040A]NTX11342.1 cation:proton antiporter [Myxococcus sp. CA056]NTX34558.1 cation:proton antiporter [Myxococcus sp. CA033]NTX54218.1 cation:proton antiporter [Myxococcus sp. CA039A]TQF17002.1 potassium transporter [Myxococcus llanfairpwllgwyngyllgogerychwyrndrobwllllantysiliogogogochensis]